MLRVDAMNIRRAERIDKYSENTLETEYID